MSNPPTTTFVDETDGPPRTELEVAAQIKAHWVQSGAQEQKRKRLFAEMTAVTIRDISWRSRFNAIEAQRLKIIGLKTQMTQMQKGYRRKIAKLERRIAELSVQHGQ